jgi:hypothetical protein
MYAFAFVLGWATRAGLVALVLKAVDVIVPNKTTKKE